MSTAPDAKASKLGNVGTNFWLGLLALSLIVFGANTGVATWQGSRLAGASTGAADLQVLSQQLANQGVRRWAATPKPSPSSRTPRRASTAR
jgi:hypothetical protein